MTGHKRMLAVLLLAATGCAEGAVEWMEDQASDVPGGTSSSTRLVLDASGRVQFVSADSAAAPPDAAGACPGSVRFASVAGEDAQLYAAWWQPRADSSVALLASHSPDGGRTWGRTVPVDTVDRGSAGCRRPAPAVAASGDYVHVAYSLRGPEGTGVFFSHSMDRAALFHAPVPIVYGDRLTTADIAADGDRVAVAYVDPNTSPPRVGLALSRTMGHIFEDRMRVSPDIGEAKEPLVGVAGDRVAISWLGGASATARFVRTGRLR